MGVVGRGSISFDIAEFKEALGKLGNKLRTAVGHNVLREAVVLENMAEVQVGGVLGGNMSGCRAEMSHLGETIHCDIDSVESLRRGSLTM